MDALKRISKEGANIHTVDAVAFLSRKVPIRKAVGSMTGEWRRVQFSFFFQIPAIERMKYL